MSRFSGLFASSSSLRLASIAVAAATFVSVLALPGAAHAQAFFQPLGGSGSQSQTLPAGTMPLGVAVADFNHDGYPDMAVANKTDTSLGTTGTISVYLSNGTGGFSAPVKYPTCGGPTAVLAEDLDLTGLPDIVITCNTPTSNVIEVFLNLGNGTFNPVVDGVTNIVLGTGLGPVAITSADFNRDGHPDLAVADSGDGTVTVFLSNPANNFTSYTVETLTGLGTPTAITTGIFGQFGHVSLAVTDSANNVVHILNNNGNGGFTAMPNVPTQAGPDAIVSGDFNHNGFIDLAVVNSNAGTVSILFGKNNNTFQPATPISIGPATGTGSQSILAMDVNGDGYQDLLIGNPLQNQVALLLNNGDGTFQPVENYAVPNGPTYLAVGDFNRDGKPDLAVTQSTGATVSLLINNTLPTPTPRGGLNFVAPHTLINGHGNMADGVAVADFNHDGYPDIAASYFEDNSVRVLPGIGGGNFNPAVAYPVGKQPYSVTAGDLNNDGFADLVTANAGDNTISVLMNSGSGNGRFFAAQSYPVGRLPYQVAIGDLNGDGIPDLAVTNYGDNTVSILYGQVGGGFTGGQTLATCTNPYGVAIGDTRNTGQNDIAVTCFHTAQMEVFLNNNMLPFQPPPAQASFQSPEIYSTDSFPTSLVMADFNRDGNLDIVTGNSIANDVSFFGGHGDGTFASGVISPSLNFPDSIAAGDINGDGIPDLVEVAPNFQQVVVSLGKGDGTFGNFYQRVEFASGQQPWAVALADFNRDGKLDIVTANTVNQVNLTIPAYQTMYMNEFPPTAQGGPSLNVLLNGSGTTIALTSPTGTVTPTTPVTLTATVSPSLGSSKTTPTGTVTFEDSDGTVLGSGPVTLSGGTASLTVPNLGSGNHQITVLYSGDVLYQPNTETGAGFVVSVSGTPVIFTYTGPVTAGITFPFSVVVGTAGSASAPVGTASVYVIPPGGGSPILIAGPSPVVDNGNGTATYSSTLVGGPAGTYYGYAVFTPTSGTYTAGSSPTVAVAVTAGP
ncbi:MAG: FG-GAP-like repeat-containing protein [Acidobacteriaceae bacterium]